VYNHLNRGIQGSSIKDGLLTDQQHYLIAREIYVLVRQLSQRFDFTVIGLAVILMDWLWEA
jgi:hypothetical protein